jgi:MFS family permease
LLGLYIPFLDGANGLIMTRFHYNEETTGRIIMVTYFAAAFFSIPIGLLIDKIGQRRIISMFCAILLLVVQLIIYFSDENTHIIIIGMAFLLLGMGFAIYANCVLSCISLIVKRKILGTAFGLVQMLESVSLSVFPIISGALVD